MTRHREAVLRWTTPRTTSCRASRVSPWRPMSRPMASGSCPASTSTYITPSTSSRSRSASRPMSSSSPARNSSAMSTCSSSSSWDTSGSGARTRTTAGWLFSPRNPRPGSWTISISAACSLIPSSSRASSTASSTLAALLSTSRIGLLPRRLGRRGPRRRRALPVAIDSRPVAQDHRLLSDLPDVGGHPVHQHPGGDRQRQEPEQGRHELHHQLLLLGDLPRRCRELPLLVERGEHHQRHQDEERDGHGEPTPAIDPIGRSLDQLHHAPPGLQRATAQVHPQEAGLPRVDGLRQAAPLGEVSHSRNVSCARLVRIAPKDRIQSDEHGHLKEEREAPAQRVDLVLLVQLHDLFVELLPVPLVLLLQRLDLGLDLLHLVHRSGLLQREGDQDDPNGQREKDDGHPVGRDGIVEEREDLAEPLQDGLPHGY